MKRTCLLLAFATALTIAIVIATPAWALDSLELTARGNEMAPTILDGDTVHVQICINASLVQTGSRTDTHPGDIIVYCALAAGCTSSMWMCGRAISKHYDGQYWIIQTQMDNNCQPDDWTVPEYDLLGIVTQISHNSNAQNQQSTHTNQQSASQPPQDQEQDDSDQYLLDFAKGMALCLISAILFAMVLAITKLMSSWHAPFFGAH